MSYHTVDFIGSTHLIQASRGTLWGRDVHFEFKVAGFEAVSVWSITDARTGEDIEVDEDLEYDLVKIFNTKQKEDYETARSSD